MRYKKNILLIVLILISGSAAYYAISKGVFNWKVATAFFFALFFLVYGLQLFLFRFVKIKPETQKNIQIKTLGIFIGLACFELLLRGMGFFSTYGEQNGNPNYYMLSNSQNLPSWYYVHEPNQTLNYNKAEFNWERRTNSLGLSELEIPIAKDSNEYRILALGDSFTEGDGVPSEKTWLKKLEEQLQTDAPQRKIRTINAGIGGSDPVFEYVLLRDKLLPFRPDLVILSINESDLSDIGMRGGMQRFRANGTVHICEPYAWEPLYGLFYTVRFFMQQVLGYSQQLNLDRQFPEAQSPSVIAAMADSIYSLGQKTQFELLIVLHPVEKEFQTRPYENPGMQELRTTFSQGKVPFIDLKAILWEQGFDNPGKAAELYWPANRHFNEKGYLLYANGVADFVRQNETQAQTASEIGAEK